MPCDGARWAQECIHWPLFLPGWWGKVLYWQWKDWAQVGVWAMQGKKTQRESCLESGKGLEEGNPYWRHWQRFEKPSIQWENWGALEGKAGQKRSQRVNGKRWERKRSHLGSWCPHTRVPTPSCEENSGGQENPHSILTMHLIGHMHN